MEDHIVASRLTTVEGLAACPGKQKYFERNACFEKISKLSKFQTIDPAHKVAVEELSSMSNMNLDSVIQNKHQQYPASIFFWCLKCLR